MVLPQLINQMNDLVFLSPITADETLPIIEVNDIAIEKLGYSRDELFSMTYKNIAEPESLIRKRHSYIRDGDVYECKYVTKQGLKLSVEVNSRIFELNGKKVILKVARDVTHRKPLFEKMFDKSVNLMLVSEVMPGGEIRIIEVNHCAYSKLGFSKDELLAKSCFDILTNKKSEKLNLLKKLFSDGQIDVRTGFEMKNGQKLAVDVTKSLFHANGRKYIQSVARDLSELQHAEDDNADRGKKLRVLMAEMNINQSPQ